MEWKELYAYSKDQQNLTNHPGRVEGSAAELYDQYKGWCEENGLTNAEYVEQYVQWQRCVAIEPCLVPYNIAHPAQHWILWHHPGNTPGDTVLEPEEQFRLVQQLLSPESNLLQSDTICFQNVPTRRSIPTIAHAHVFINTADEAVLRVLADRRKAWQARSPFLNAV